MYKKVKDYLGIDQSILWASINKGFGVVRGPLTIYFMLKYLTLDQQGYWYTFTNLSALTMLADLGFTSIILYFISHDFSNLNIEENKIVGDYYKKDRLISFIKFSLKVYSIVIVISFLILLLAGLFFFKNDYDKMYNLWVLYSLYGVFSIFVALVQTILQGLDRMKEVFFNLFMSSLFVTAFICLFLYLRLNLLSLVAGSFIGLFITALGLFLSNRSIFLQIINYRSTEKYSFFNETIKLQVKFAISFIASYIIGYVTVPIVFKYSGVDIAGKLGLTMMVLTSFVGLANNWIFTKVPKFNYLVADNLYHDAYLLFRNCLFRAISVFLILSTLFILFLVAGWYFYPEISNRFLEIKVFVLLLLIQFLNFIMDAFTIFLRSFKKDPLMILQIVKTFIILVTIYFSLIFCKKSLNFYFVTLLMFSFFVFFPISLFVFKKELKSFKVNTNV